MPEDQIKFLKESNAIEAVYDDDSLENAKSAWEYLVGNYELTVDMLCGVHYVLMENHLWEQWRGCFRRVDVTVGGAPVVKYQELKQAIDKWIAKANFLMKFPYSEKERENISRSLHVDFERIHPFVDGNGRAGRMLMNWWRVWVGLPVLVVLEKDKQSYYNWFKG